MTIKGLNNAIHSAIERARRTKQSICIVQVGSDEYVLWREVTKASIAYVYTYYRIIKVIGYKDDIRR